MIVDQGTLINKHHLKVERVNTIVQLWIARTRKRTKTEILILLNCLEIHRRLQASLLSLLGIMK